jgi:ATP synthase protein I
MADGPDPQSMWGGMSAGWQVSAYLLSAVVVYGGIGYLIDWLAGTGNIFTAVGMIAGAVLGTYLIYVKYGKDHDRKP